MHITPTELQILLNIYMYIHRNIYAEFTLSTFIADCKISQATLIKAYKQVFTKTPNQHRIYWMMKHAEIRIASGEHIKKVASEIGYSNSRNFGRVYRKTLGYHPSNLTRGFNAKHTENIMHQL